MCSVSGCDRGSRVHLGWGMRCVGCSGRKGMSDLDPSCLPPLQITLECTLRPGLVYNKVNPIFHHWSLGDCKFGLTFQSPAEADEFQKSLLAALAALGRGEWCRWWGLEPGLVWVGSGRSLAPRTHCSASLPTPGSLTPSSSSSSSSPSQDTAETPCPLTVSLLGATLPGGQGAISILQTFLSTYCVSTLYHVLGTQIWAKNDQCQFQSQ